MPTPSRASLDPETVQWVYDDIPFYRLNPGIIAAYLQSKWSDYDEFFVEASALRLTLFSSEWPRLMDGSQLVERKYRFWVPRKLREVIHFASIPQTEILT